MYYGERVIIQRLEKFLRQNATCYYGQREALTAVCTVDEDPIPFGKLDARKWRTIQPGESWGHGWQSAWFRFSGRVPLSWRGSEVVALVDTGSEACVFDDQGHPFCGLTSKVEVTDSLYRKAMIPLSQKGGVKIELLVEAAANDLMGLQGEARLKECHLTVFKREYWQWFHDLLFLFDLAGSLPEKEPRRARVFLALNQALNRYGNGDLEELSQAREIIRPQLQAKASSTASDVSAIGHGHLDLVWLWPLRETIRKAGRTFSSALCCMREYPEYKFAASQPQLYQLVKEQYPELFLRIKKAVSEGRWEPLGAMWVEPDCNIPSGESLVRQIYYGKRFYRREFGVEVDNLWLPDTFGFSPVLPQLMRKSGIEYFMSQKMSWSKTNDFPHHSFTWVGLDGSAVFAHFLPSNTMNSKVLPAELLFGAGNFRQKDRCTRWLFTFGEGDGGGGPGRHHLELARRAGNCAGLPRVTQRFVRDFFKQAAKESEDLPRWHGELYLETHRGTLTTCGKTKWYNRKSETLLHDLELLLVLNHVLLGDGYPGDKLEELWQTLLLHQFHDILPGTTIRLAFEESSRRFEELIAETRAMIEGALQAFAAGAGVKETSKALLLINSTAFVRHQVFELPSEYLKPEQELVSTTGESVPVQRGRESLFLECTLPASGFRLLNRKPGTGKQTDGGGGSPRLRVSQKILENSKLQVEFSRDGLVKRIFDKEERREVLAGGKANELLLFRDEPIGYDAWDIDPYYRETVPEQSRLLTTEVHENGPLCVSLLQERSISKSRISQEIRLYRNSRRIEFKTRVELQEDQKTLKVLFPLNIHSENARFDIQFGNIARPTFRNTSWEQAKYEVFAHKWVDLSEHGYGVALLNDCKYGHNAQRNLLELTLLRSPVDPDPERDRGTHHFTYTLLPHRGDFREGGVIPDGYFLNFPVLHVLNVGSAGGPDGWLENRSLFSVDAAHVVLETVKHAEQDEAVVLRLYEAFGGRGEVGLRTPLAVRRADEVDLMEDKLGALPVKKDEQGSIVPFDIKPYEIKTLKLWIEPGGRATDT